MLSDATIRKAQKYIYLSAFILSVLFLVYSLVFSTDLFPLRNFADEEDGFYAEGAEVYFHAQPFNKALLALAALMLLISISNYVFFAPSRRLFYISNYLTSGLTVVYSVFMAVFTMINVAILRAEFLKVNFEDYKMLADSQRSRYTESTFYFDIGFVICALALIVSGLITAIVIYKLRLKKGAKEGK